MKDISRTPLGDALTDVILDVFRLNGRLLVAGDRLVADLGLTSARWQVLGAIAMSDQPQPVSWLARSMGLNRQGVQRIVNDLHKDGIVEFALNPHHRRAHLVVLTKRGKNTFDRADRLQRPWVNELAEGFSMKDIEIAKRVVGRLRERLERQIER
jgi:DNA-binding MarR family transcriptional regulator